MRKIIFWVYCICAMAVFAFAVTLIKDVSIKDDTYNKLQASATSANMPISEYAGGIIDEHITEIEKDKLINEYYEKESLIKQDEQKMAQAIICFNDILK